jgi:hypothetical protein
MTTLYSVMSRAQPRANISEEASMCPACIASAAAIVAGGGSTGGILALCIGRLKVFFRANPLALCQKAKEK